MKFYPKRFALIRALDRETWQTARAVTERAGAALALKPNRAAWHLYRLQRRGLVETRVKVGADLTQRTEYRLTAAGGDMLARWALAAHAAANKEVSHGNAPDHRA